MTEASATLRIPETFFEGGSVADAFHGTLEGLAQRIAKEGFSPSVDAGQHFGPGIYFFESDYLAACWFAGHRRRELKSADREAVIQAKVLLGRTFYANAIAVDVEKTRLELSRQLGMDVPPRVIFRLVGNRLHELGLIDSLKVVRKRTKPDPEPASYGTEIVLLVYDPKRIQSPQIRHPRDLGRTHTIDITFGD
jgi:hypothetical protein